MSLRGRPARTLTGGRIVFRNPVGEDRAWLVAMAGLAVIELAWWAIEWRIGAAPAPFVGTYLILTFSGLGVATLLRLALRITASSASWPAVAAGTFLVAIGASAFLPLKYAIPSEVPFWLDRPLAVAERAIFGGDPWLLIDRLLGWATTPMDWLYGCWLPTQLLILFLVMLSAPSRAKSRSLIAYSLAWFLLGAVAAMLLSSAGPLFYDRIFGGDTFGGLTQNLQNRRAWVVLAESNRMWASMTSHKPGLASGISAMPSIHVAISLWIFLAARTMAPRLSAAAFAYFILIWIGSVQLGWHYASDGLVGALGMLVVWGLARTLERALQRPFSSQSAFPA